MLALIPFLGSAIAIITFAFPSVVNSLLSTFGSSLNSKVPRPLGLTVIF